MNEEDQKDIMECFCDRNTESRRKQSGTGSSFTGSL